MIFCNFNMIHNVLRNSFPPALWYSAINSTAHHYTPKRQTINLPFRLPQGKQLSIQTAYKNTIPQ